MLRSNGARGVEGSAIWGRPACAGSPLRRGSLRLSETRWLAEPKLAEGERRLVDLTGIEPVTS